MKNIFLDMDGVLSDFASGALSALNSRYNKRVTLDTYVREYGKWNIAEYYGITDKEFWETIGKIQDFWLNLQPIPWYERLYGRLTDYGTVTILTTPSLDPYSFYCKLIWLYENMYIKSDQVILGARKELLAGNGVLIDDSLSNVKRFEEAGGKAILIPSTWNTPNLTFEQVWEMITQNL